MPRVLVAEQRPEYRRQIAVALKSLLPNIEIVTPDTFPAVLEMLKQDPPNLLILDPHFEEKMARQMLADFPINKRGFPILLTLLESTPKVIDTWLSLGGDDFIVKPLDEELLRMKANSLLHKAAASAHVYYGVDDGLSPVVFAFDTEIELLTEDEIQFLAPVMISRETRIKIMIGDMKVPALVRDVTRKNKADDLHAVMVYSTAARLETLGQFSLQVAIRKYIRQLGTSASEQAPA